MRSGTPSIWLFSSLLFGRVSEACRSLGGTGADTRLHQQPPRANSRGPQDWVALAVALLLSLISVQKRRLPFFSSFLPLWHAEGSSPAAGKVAEGGITCAQPRQALGEPLVALSPSRLQPAPGSSELPRGARVHQDTPAMRSAPSGSAGQPRRGPGARAPLHARPTAGPDCGLRNPSA